MIVSMIREAVGAVVIYEDEILLVRKINTMSTGTKPIPIEGEWDFPKGGIKEEDQSMADAVLRELWEETGVTSFEIIKEFNQKIIFSFPEATYSKTGFSSQETTMFLIKYIGNSKEFVPQDEEIDCVRFFKKEKIMETLSHAATKRFFEEIIYQI